MKSHVFLALLLIQLSVFANFDLVKVNALHSWQEIEIKSAHASELSLLSIEFRDVNNRSFTLSELRQRVILLDFYADWCPPCDRQIEEVKQIRHLYTEDQVAIVYVIVESPDFTDKEIRGFAESHGYNWIFARSVIGGLNHYKNYGVKNLIPQIHLIDGKGTIRYVHEGYVGANILVSEIGQIMSESTMLTSPSIASKSSIWESVTVVLIVCLVATILILGIWRAKKHKEASSKFHATRTVSSGEGVGSRKMEIYIDIPKLRKVVRLEVQADHSLESILGTICECLHLVKRDWGLAINGKAVEKYSKTIQQLGIKDGNRLLLLEKPSGALPTITSEVTISRRRFSKRAAVATAAFGVVALGAYYGARPTPNTMPTTSPTLIQTSSSPLTATRTPTPQTDLCSLRILREYPDAVVIEIDYSYGPDKLPSKYAGRLVLIGAELPNIPGNTYYAHGPHQVGLETAKNGTARISLQLCRKSGTQANMTVRTEKVWILMYVEGSESDRTFFEKIFDFPRTWSELKEQSRRIDKQ